jgi:hypothetical protein
MVQEVTLQLSALNGIPGVSGVEDVTLRIPQVSDIREEIRDAVPDPTDLETAAEEGFIAALEDATALDELVDLLVDPIVAELEEQLGIDFPSPEEIGQEVADRINIPDLTDAEIEIEGSLFAIGQDFADIIQEALDVADLVDVAEFPTLEEVDELIPPVGEIIREEFRAFSETIEGLLQDFRAETVALLLGLDRIGDEPADDILERFLREKGLDGDRPLIDQIVDQQIDRVTSGLVSEEVRQDLQETLDDL